MESLFDRVSRILAADMSRSAAIKLIVGGVAGTVLAEFGFGQQGRGQGPCPDPRKCPGIGEGSCCPEGQRCCPAGPGHSQSFCCAPSSVCCGTTCCPPAKFCANGNNCRDRTPSDPLP